jgi:predicted O-linked N-acetylglucosamine transferase (SPINDLY family)
MAFNVSRALLKAKGLSRKGDVDGAAQLFMSVLEQFPQNKEAAKGLASIGRTRSPALAQGFQQDLKNLVDEFNAGKLQQALSAGKKMAAQYPDQPLIHNVVGAAYKSLHHYDEAIAAFTQAVRLQPDYAEAYNNLGAAYHDIKQYKDAVLSYSKAVQYSPGFFEAYRNLGNVLAESGRPQEAIASYAKAIQIKPNSAVAVASMLLQLAQICDWDVIASNAALIPELGVVGEHVFPFDVLHLEDHPARHRARSELYARTQFQARAPAVNVGPNVKPERLRIGYFSADFHDHATMHLMARLFELHDSDQFEVVVYSYGIHAEDKMRNRLKDAVNEFHDVRDLGDSEIARLSRSHEIDIAVDLKGYTQHSRLGIFSYRAAPIQISYLGYPGTTGAPFIDYLIADAVVIPKAQAAHYSEQIIYLPHSYQVNDNIREISDKAITRATAGLPETGFIFCCFNNNYKIGAGEFDIWMRLLQQVEDSVLWLFKSNAWAQANLRKAAQQRGVEPERIVFADRVPQAEHLARHQLADLFLDTFRYNAHTTASDALWAGLPLLTCTGEGFPARVAASLLTAVELPELITSSEQEYEQLALELAHNPERLTAMKVALANHRTTTPLFNTERFTEHLEQAYQQVYQCYFDGKEPASIEVQP